jgi:hypothetical protein
MSAAKAEVESVQSVETAVAAVQAHCLQTRRFAVSLEKVYEYVEDN